MSSRKLKRPKHASRPLSRSLKSPTIILPTKKGHGLKIFLIIFFLLLLIGGGIFVYFHFFHKKSKNGDEGGNGVGDKCKNDGSICLNPNECCTGLVCNEGVCEKPCLPLDVVCGGGDMCCHGLKCMNGICQTGKNYDTLHAFQIKQDGKCLVIPDFNTQQLVLGSCDWDEEFWSWNGELLTYTNFLKNSSGIVINVDTVCVDGRPSKALNNQGVNFVNLSDADKVKGYVGLRKLENGTALIETNNGKLCSIIQNNQLMWKLCSEIPDIKTNIFELNIKDSDQACQNDTDCDAPFHSCSGGKCALCFNKPDCSNAEYGRCNAITHKWDCIGRCPGKDSCEEPNEIGVCIKEGDKWGWKCMSRCKDARKICNSGEQAVCTKGTDGNWSWICPIVCSDKPKPAFKGKCRLDGKMKDLKDCEKKTVIIGGNTQVYWKCDDVCVDPEWKCIDNDTGEYQCVKRCCPSSAPNCKKGQKPVCDGSKGTWSCVNDDKVPDKCGLSTKPSCSDAVCINISDCGQGSGGITDWQWKCLSNMNKCEYIKYKEWKTVSTETGPEIITNEGDVPIYPTIMFGKCRDLSGTDRVGKDVQELINNPPGYLINKGGKRYFEPIASASEQKNGSGEYLYTTGTTNGVDIPCIADNPCYPHGTYTPNDGVWPVRAHMSNGEFAPATKGELLDVGKCSCTDGYIGDDCLYPPDYCGKNGTPTWDETDQKVKCVCDVGYNGDKCEQQLACGIHGTVVMGSDGRFICNCAPGWSGSDCNTTPGCPFSSLPPVSKTPIKSLNFQLAWDVQNKPEGPKAPVKTLRYNGLENIALIGIPDPNRKTCTSENSLYYDKEKSLIYTVDMFQPGFAYLDAYDPKLGCHGKLYFRALSKTIAPHFIIGDDNRIYSIEGKAYVIPDKKGDELILTDDVKNSNKWSIQNPTSNKPPSLDVLNTNYTCKDKNLYFKGGVGKDSCTCKSRCSSPIKCWDGKLSTECVCTTDDCDTNPSSWGWICPIKPCEGTNQAPLSIQSGDYHLEYNLKKKVMIGQFAGYIDLNGQDTPSDYSVWDKNYSSWHYDKQNSTIKYNFNNRKITVNDDCSKVNIKNQEWKKYKFILSEAKNDMNAIYNIDSKQYLVPNGSDFNLTNDSKKAYVWNFSPVKINELYSNFTYSPNVQYSY